MTLPTVEAPQTPGRPRRLLIGAVLILVVVALVAGGFVASRLARPSPAEAGPKSSTPTEAIQGYFAALAAGRADDALAYGLTEPAERTFLTDAALAASRAVGGPVSVLSIGSTDATSQATVPVTVRIGTHTASLDVELSRTLQGWRLLQPTAQLTVGTLGASLPLLVNGQAAPVASTFAVFPGVYKITSGVREIEASSGELVVDGLGNQLSVDLVPTLSAAGKARLLKLARSSLASCLKQKSTLPKGCPNVVLPAKGQIVNAKSVVWTLDKDPWKKVAYSVSATEPTKGTGRMAVDFRLHCTLKQDGDPYEVDQLVHYTVLFQADLGPIGGNVTWQRL